MDYWVGPECDDDLRGRKRFRDAGLPAHWTCVSGSIFSPPPPQKLTRPPGFSLPRRMSPSLEDAIERFVRYPDTLRPEERTGLARLIEEDVTARDLAEFYRSFYADLDGVPNGDGSGEPTSGTRPA